MERLDVASYSRIIEQIRKTACGTVYPRSVAEMKQFGDIFAEGGSLLIWHYCGFAYIFGECGDDFLDDVYRQFLSWENTLPRRFVLFTADTKVEQFFREKQGLVFGKRYGFKYTAENIPTPKALPQGFSLCEFDGELFDSVQGRITPRFAWRNSAEFLKNGSGFCIMHDEEPAAWAFFAAVSSDEIDIGIETSADYQHRGLATIAAEAMIRCCLEKGKCPVWACDVNNEASRKLAEKVGFAKTAEYTTIKAK